MKEILEVENLSYQYLEKLVLKKISFSLRKGEIATLIGSSGSGKTTLFKLLAGIITPDNGMIRIMGEQIQNCRGHVSYMMQEDLLLPWRNVLRNITLCSELGKSPQYGALDEEAQDLLQRMEMGGCDLMYPAQLSGGMRQRVALARAILQKKPLLFLDEPFAALDVLLREQMYAILRKVHSNDRAILLVTHDFRDAIALSDRVLLLSNGVISKEWSITEEIRNDPYKVMQIQSEMRSNL